MPAVSASTRSAIFGPPGRVIRVTVRTPWGVNTQVHAELDELFIDACLAAYSVSDWRPQRIDSYNPRPIRGHDGDRLEEWSLHAWCLAWDFFITGPGVPPPGGVWSPINPVPVEFAECFTRRGFRWGASFRRVDVPHIEWAGGQPPERSTPVAVPPVMEERMSTLDLCPHPLDPNRLDMVLVGSDGLAWHGWGTPEDPAAHGLLRLASNFLLRDDTVPSSAWNADATKYTVAGIGRDDHVWAITWDDELEVWGEPVQTRAVAED